MLDVPEIALMNDEGNGSENCLFTNDFAYSKNCYLCFVTWYNEDCYYSTGIHYSKNTIDSLDTMKSELCYECIDSNNCYHCIFLKYCENCTDCFFGYDLRNCTNCFKCAGLRNKQYCIENKQYSKEDYEKIVTKEIFSSFTEFSKHKESFFKFLKKVPQKSVMNTNSEESIGNKLQNCKNVIGFENYDCRDSKYIYHCNSVKDSFDLTNTGRAELCYETLVSNDGYMSLFTNECWNSKDAIYSNHCFNCEHIFGCSGLKKKKYCILNKQYSKEEYEILVPKIIEYMIQTKEWGEFFPMEISPFKYEETVANEYFPQSPNKERIHQPIKNDIPDNINEITDEITKQKLLCEDCGKSFKIISSELNTYKKLKLPIPRQCPNCRHLARMELRNPRSLWKRECNKCKQKTLSTYPNSETIVYCEKCYLEEVY